MKRQEEKKRAFKARVHHWADKLEVKVTWLGVRPMRNKWASCSTSGHLNFNADLLGLDEALWDYVIVHELLHLFVPNHGRLWKGLMRAHLGDYEAMGAELARHTHSPATNHHKIRTVPGALLFVLPGLDWCLAQNRELLFREP